MKFSIKLAAFCLLMTAFAFSATAQNQRQIEKASTETTAIATDLGLDAATTEKVGEVELKYTVEKQKIDQRYRALRKANGNLTDEEKTEKQAAYRAMYKEKNQAMKPVLGDKMKDYRTYLDKKRAAKKAAKKG